MLPVWEVAADGRSSGHALPGVRPADTGLPGPGSLGTAPSESCNTYSPSTNVQVLCGSLKLRSTLNRSACRKMGEIANFN